MIIMQTQGFCMSWPEEWRAPNTEMSYHSHVSAWGELTLGSSWFLLVWADGLKSCGSGDKHCDNLLDFPRPMQHSHKAPHFFTFFF